jgi:phosphoribosylformylglycinamidine (FGAM) synthase-like enzyme
MAQLSAAIDGISEACTALGTPVTGGNVSLYNETRGEGIYPTPVIGIVGILEDVGKAVPSGFQRAGDAILLLGPKLSDAGEGVGFGSSEFAKTIFGSVWGGPPDLDIQFEARLQAFMTLIAAEQLIASASDVSDGGLSMTLAKAGFSKMLGVNITNVPFTAIDFAMEFSNEFASCIIVSCSEEKVGMIEALASSVAGLVVTKIGVTTASAFFLQTMTETAIDTDIETLKKVWGVGLESSLVEEVFA